MTTSSAKESSTIDAVDLGLIHCLQLDGRIPFRRVAEVLGVSEQTVARRYRTLRADGVVRVVGVRTAEAYGQTGWIVRVQTRPDSTSTLASALAERDDVSWVRVAADSTISAALRLRSAAERDELLLSRLPRHAQVLGLTVHSVLHRFVRTGGSDWTVGSPLIDDRTAAQLLGQRTGVTPQGAPDPEDEPLLDALAVDGRAAVAELAAQLGWSAGRTARRLGALLESNVVYIDCDLAVEAVGYSVLLELWLTVEPARLHDVGQAVADMPEIAYAAAVTGSVNLTAAGLFRTGDDLYTFLTERIGRMPGVRSAETTTTLRWVKQAGSLRLGERLAGPRSPEPGRRSPARSGGATRGRTSASRR